MTALRFDRVDLAEVYGTKGQEVSLAVLATHPTDGPVAVIHVSATDTYGVLEHVFVLPEFRRRGIGKQLVEQARAALSEVLGLDYVPMWHDNTISMDGSRFVGPALIGKLANQPFTRLNRQVANQTGAQLLVTVATALRAAAGRQS